ncbi:MAG: hypothetical protein OHK0022_33340 [Roseiflexaceae bacterium]
MLRDSAPPVIGRAVAPHPNMSHNPQIESQKELLVTYRQTLGFLLEQAAAYGGEVLAPPQTRAGLVQMREGVAQCKRELRSLGVAVDDDPNDTATVAAQPGVNGTPLPAPPDAYSQYRAYLLRLLPPADASAAPYQGLLTFQYEHADRFFGRDQLVVELAELVQRAPFLAVLGASGSGKSSLVQAGLLPLLKAGALPGSQNWHYLTLKPGARPLDSLAAALTEARNGSLIEALELSPRLAANDDALLLAARMFGPRLVLIIDQAEELWTLQPVEPEARRLWQAQQQRPFIRLLLSALRAGDQPLLVILTMRADFLHRAADDPALARAISEHDVIVSPMMPEELRETIERPALQAGGRFETGLVDELVEQAHGQPGALPLLEYTLLALWKQRDASGQMTWESYRRLGGVEGALAKRADLILEQRYTAEQRGELRRVLPRLIQPGEGAADTRRRAALADLATAGQSPAAVQALLQPLIDERLLTSGQMSDTAAVVEISHEALIRNWPTLRQWIEESRADLRLQIQLEEAAKEWRASGENADLLWGGLKLSSAEAWVARARPRLNERDAAFLAASRADEQRLTEQAAQAERDRQRLAEAALQAERDQQRISEQQRIARRLRAIASIAGVSLVITLVAVVFATRSWQDAAKANAQAQSLAWAGQALDLLDAGPEHAMAFVLASQSSDPSMARDPFVMRALMRTLDRGRLRQVLGQEGDATTAVLALAWSPDSGMLLAGSQDGTARLWDAAEGTLLHTLQGHSGAVRAAVWSPDGQTVLTGSEDGTARLWNVAEGTLLRTLQGHSGAVRAANWSPDGKTVLTGSADATARLWETASGRLLFTLQGHTAGITTVVWSPDGQTVLTGSEDAGARLWSASSGQLLQTLAGHSKAVTVAAWSPDGKTVLTASEDWTARLWDAASGQSLKVLQGHTSLVTAVAWNPDGTTVLTGSNDSTARLWDVTSGQAFYVLRGHSGAITAVAWGSDGTTVLTTSADKTARLWSTTTGQQLNTLVGHNGAITAVAWSPDGAVVATGADDHTVRLWDATNGQTLHQLHGHTSDILTAAWSPDGALVATGSDDSSARLWDAESGQLLHILEGHTGAVAALAWSPDGTTLLTGSEDGSARIWSSAGQAVHLLQGHSATVHAVAWCPDGKTVLTGSEDGTARLWDVSSGQTLHILKGHSDAVVAVAWSPDGATVLTGSKDTTARLWKASDGTTLFTLAGHSDTVTAVAWRPDSQRVLTSGWDGNARVWDAGSGTLVEVSPSRAGASWTEATWSPDGTRIMLASTKGDGMAVVWTTGTTSTLDLRGRVGDVSALTWSSDGRMVAAGSADGAVYLWEVQSGREIYTLQGHISRVSGLAWSPDGKTLLTSSYDDTARIWALDRELLVADLTRRVCDTTNQGQTIGEVVKGWVWDGCPAALSAVQTNLTEYDRLRGR